MKTHASEFAAVAQTLLTNIRDLLDSPDPGSRVTGVHHLVAGVQALERQVLVDAQASGLTWAQIGDIYGVSRQAAHRRFSDDTIVPAGFFDQLLQDLDHDTEAVPTLARAASRVRRANTA
jgi:hypothetical protein